MSTLECSAIQLSLPKTYINNKKRHKAIKRCVVLLKKLIFILRTAFAN